MLARKVAYGPSVLFWKTGNRDILPYFIISSLLFGKHLLGNAERNFSRNNNVSKNIKLYRAFFNARLHLLCLFCDGPMLWVKPRHASVT